jgi:A/G-specific adenine glycosylase
MTHFHSQSREELQISLLSWYNQQKRSLPWRQTRDPYKIWVSEIMLQQTTVQTVIPRWQRFLERFPTVHSLAQATEEEVLALWLGLGYYSRARNLWKAARLVTQELGGEIPTTFEGLLALPGMGRYTASAVASIAYQEPVAVLDANVERVLSRWHALNDEIRNPRVKRQLWEWADAVLLRDQPGDWNQAMMELGALICLPRNPRCEGCPVKKSCRAFDHGDPESYPNKGKKAESIAVREVAIWLQRPDGKLLGFQRSPKGSFALMWELPKVRCQGMEERLITGSQLWQSLGLGAGRITAPLFEHRHVVMNTKIHLSVHRVEGDWKGDKPNLPPGLTAYEWMEPEEFRRRAISSTTDRVLKALMGNLSEGTFDVESDGDLFY